MNEVKFTKAEWRLRDGHYPGFVEVHCGKSMRIPVCTIATDITYEQGVERKANALLIAAAPEMYEMLDKVVRVAIEAPNETECADRIMMTVDEIEKLLAKARGEV